METDYLIYHLLDRINQISATTAVIQKIEYLEHGYTITIQSNAPQQSALEILGPLGPVKEDKRYNYNNFAVIAPGIGAQIKVSYTPLNSTKSRVAWNTLIAITFHITRPTHFEQIIEKSLRKYHHAALDGVITKLSIHLE